MIVLLESHQKLADSPNVVSQASRHRGRLFVNAAMLAAEVKEGEEQSESRFQVLPLLAESVRQARESSHLHSDREVLTLNNRSTDSFGVRVAVYDRSLYVHHNGWRVASFAVTRGSINFSELREINVLMLKSAHDSITVGSKAVRGDLEAILIPSCRTK